MAISPDDGIEYKMNHEGQVNNRRGGDESLPPKLLIIECFGLFPQNIHLLEGHIF